MTHRHEWILTEDGIETHQLPYCRECERPMDEGEILRRLNDYERLKKATDLLSAEDAVRMARTMNNHLGFHALTKDELLLLTYAKTLRGE